jgi:hypothetical protein
MENTFSDVAGGAYYGDAVKWAAENGIVNGNGNGQFDPDGNITRQDLAVIISNYMTATEINIPVTEQYVLFADDAEIADYAKNAVQLLNKLGLINGVGNNTIDPKGEATRAQTAAMLHRFVELVK